VHSVKNKNKLILWNRIFNSGPPELRFSICRCPHAVSQIRMIIFLSPDENFLSRKDPDPGLGIFYKKKILLTYKMFYHRSNECVKLSSYGFGSETDQKNLAAIGIHLSFLRPSFLNRPKRNILL
jgi:hypothetical protein